MNLFHAIDDASLACLIQKATRKIVYVAPGIGIETSKALKHAIEHGEMSVTVIIDSDEDAYRIGYGEHDALKQLHEVAKLQQFPLRRQPGLRIGLLVSDDDLVIWAPTALSVEAARTADQPNALMLQGSVVEKVEAAVGSDQSQVLPSEAEVGQEALRPPDLEKMIEGLEANPPAPFDLAQKARVFSTRFQFVEFEIRGAEWTERKLKLSSLILNADLAEELRDILETQVRPYQHAADVEFETHSLANGELAYRKNGTPILVPTKQSDMSRMWSEIRDRYLSNVKGFGWLIRKDQLTQFRSETEAYEKCLTSWVEKFREYVGKEEGRLVDTIVKSIAQRLERSSAPDLKKIDLKAEVSRGLQRMRVIEPKVRIVLKNVAWESSRDEEFITALKNAFTPEELQG